MCRILHPGLTDDKEAYMTMVVNYMPTGAIGLIIAVLIAALVSTVDSGLNSFSTIVTLDIYKRYFNPDADNGKLKKVGRTITISAGIAGAVIALAFEIASQNIDRIQPILR